MSKFFKHNVKIYYEDTDAGGVVYYANYLKFLERARTEALVRIGLSNIKIKNDFKALIIVKSCNIEYKKSAFLEDEIIIESSITSFSRTSFTMRQNIFKNDEKILIAKIHLVFVNMEGKPTKIPENILNKFQPYYNKKL